MSENVSHFPSLENLNSLSVQAIFRPSSLRFYPPFSAKSYFFYTDVLYFDLFNQDKIGLTQGLWQRFFEDLRLCLLLITPVLLLGRLNPVGNAVYAWWDDGEEVLLVGSYLLTALDVVFERLRSSAHAGISVDASCEEGRVTQQGGEP